MADHGRIADAEIDFNCGWLKGYPDSLMRADHFVNSWNYYIDLLERIDPQSPELATMAAEMMMLIRQINGSKGVDAAPVKIFLIRNLFDSMLRHQAGDDCAQQLRIINEILPILRQNHEMPSQISKSIDLNMNAAWKNMIGHLVSHGHHELAKHESETLIQWLRNIDIRDSADLLLCEFLLTSPLPEVRNPTEAGQILARYPRENENVMKLAMYLECSKGTGNGLRILNEMTRNGSPPSLDSLTGALLDLANRKASEWSPEDNAAFTKIQEMMTGSKGRFTIHNCLIREIEARLEPSSSKSQDHR